MASADFSQFVVTARFRSPARPLQLWTYSFHRLPDLPWAIPDSYRTLISFAILSSPTGLISDFCPSDQMFAAGFLQIPSRGGHPCLWL